MIYRMKLADSVDEMTFDLLEVPIEDKDIEGATDNTTIDGNIFTDYLWLKKQFVQKWSLMCKDDYTQLRGFYTRQWENAEAPTYTLFAGQNRSETLTASGSAFQIQNGTQYDAPLTLTELKGNAKQDGTPTPDNPQPISVVTGENTVKITGKNLINENGERSSQYIDNAGNFVSGVANGYVNQQLPTKPNTAYTFSASSKTTQQVYIRIGEYRADGSFIKRNLITSLEQTITTDAECYIIKTCIDVSGGNHFTKPQLELGSTATAYEPYQGQSHTIDLGSIELAKIGNYQDRIYKQDGKWYIEKQTGRYDITGTENWKRSGRTTSTVFAGVLSNDALTAYMQIGSTECFSNRFVYKRETIAGGYDAYNFSGGVAKAFVLFVSIDSASDITAFKTWLASNPTTVYYALATPTTTEITDTTLLAQLNFIANLYGGTNNIMLVGTGAQGEIGVEYTLTYEKEQTIIPETTVRLTLTDGGVINTCECRQNVQLTMRETVQ